MPGEPSKLKDSSGKLLRRGGKLVRCGCCGDCRCSGGDGCQTENGVDEFHWTWSGGEITEHFRRTAQACCNPETAALSTTLRIHGYSGDGIHSCAQIADESGTPASSTAHIRVYEDGALVTDLTQDYDLNRCESNYANGYVDECRGDWFGLIGFGSVGEIIHTCNETLLWYTFRDASTGALSNFYLHSLVLPADGCKVQCGACCLPDGGCVETTEPDCESLGGEWTVDIQCGDASLDCAATNVGACCTEDGCSETTEEDCPGTWMGAGIPCSESPCPPEPTGACCFPDLPCGDGYTPSACAGAGGTFQGSDTTCAEQDCDPDLGACCFPDGFCDQETAVDCSHNGGEFAGLNTSCNSKICPTGACCDPTGSCSIMAKLGCDASSGHYLGDGTTCDGTDCTGACCTPTSHGVVCGIVTPSHCGGTFLGVGSTCSPNPCGLIGITRLIIGSGDGL